MSFFVSGAVVATAAVGAYSSRQASKQQAKGIEKGIEVSSELAQQARDDVMRLWGQGAKQGRAGMEGAFNFYRQAAPQRMAPVTQGFQQGINVLGQGAQQANNAILGLPVDMSFTNQQVQQAPAGYLDQAKLAPAEMPKENNILGGAIKEVMLGSANPAAAAASAAAKTGNLASTKDLLNPLNYAKDPVGGAKAIVKKIESKDPARKLLKKIF